MSLLVECEECKEKFSVSSNDESVKVVHKKEFKINGKSIFLTYYDCPSCGRRHYVQIDDEKSIRKSKDIQKTFVKLCVAKRKGKAIPEKQQEKFKKARQHLSDYRMNLMKEYTNKSVIDDDGDLFVLRFSV